MEDHIVGARIANAIMMDKTFGGHYLLVEGPKDLKFFNKFIDKKNIRTKAAFGRENVLKAFRILNEYGYFNKIGVVDSDFDKLIGTEILQEEIFVTDDHDLEVTMIKSKALDTLISTFSTTSKVDDLEVKWKVPVRKMIFSLGQEIGLLKLANKNYQIGLKFKPLNSEGNQLKYSNFVCNSTFQFLGVDAMIDAVLNYNSGKKQINLAKNEIKHCLIEVSKTSYDLNHLVNGHDLSHIIFILIKKVLSTTNKMIIDFNSIEDSLILAYDYIDFKQTKLYENLKTFADNRNVSMFLED